MSKIGVVRRWDEDRGFGFIGQDQGQSDIFVHRTCLIGSNMLNLGDKVAYDAIYDDRKQKFQAITCQLLEPANSSPSSQPLPPQNFMQPIMVSSQFMPAQLSPNFSGSPGTPPHMHSPQIAYGGVQQPMFQTGFQTPPGQQQFQQPMFQMQPMQQMQAPISPNMHMDHQFPMQMQQCNNGSPVMHHMQQPASPNMLAIPQPISPPVHTQQAQPAGVPFW